MTLLILALKFPLNSVNEPYPNLSGESVKGDNDYKVSLS